MFHHYLLVDGKEGVYVVDFSPIIETNVALTRIQLLLGRAVPAEIRLRYVHGLTSKDDKQIMQSHEVQNIADPEQSRAYTEKNYNEIREDKIRVFLDIIRANCSNNYTMLLYQYNCQHFSREALKFSRNITY
jgi:hypothetical protein